MTTPDVPEHPRLADPDDRGARFAEFAAQVIARQERDAANARRGSAQPAESHVPLAEPLDPDSPAGKHATDVLSDVIAEGLNDLIRAGKPIPACFRPDEDECREDGNSTIEQ